MAVSPEKKPVVKKLADKRPAAKSKQAAKPAGAAKTAAKKPAPKTAKVAIANVASASGFNKDKVKDDMNNFKEKASDTARNAAERGKEKASEAAFSIGKILRDNAETIDNSVGKNFGDYARSAADSIDGFATKIEAKEVDAIVDDARNFVRKSPVVAVGAAAAIGFVLVRMLRSGKDA